jgi:hypothetical protein
MFLGDRQLARLERLIDQNGTLLSHKRVELVVGWHLNDKGLAWPSLARIQLILLSEWPAPLDSGARGRAAPGTSTKTITRALAASDVYATVGKIASGKQPGGGWFVHGALRALTDPARERVGVAATLADALQWAAAAGVIAPLGELAPQRFRRPKCPVGNPHGRPLSST